MKTRNHTGRLRVLLVFAASLFTVVSLKLLPGPYVWIAAAWVVVAAFGTATGESSSRRALWFNFGVAVVLLGLFEGYFWYQVIVSRSESRIAHPEGYSVPHEILGYAPAKNFRVESARRYIGGRLIYDVPYTIGPDGLRIGPATTNDASEDCVLFFGGSLTFGEGVRDDETMPYRVGTKAAGSYKVYNFGFHGYGPNQMLAVLDHDMEREVLDCRPRYVIYQAIPDHVRRSAGLFLWARRGARYVVNEDNEVVWTGSFIKRRDLHPMIERTLRQFRKSALLQRVFIQRSIRDGDIDLFVRIVDESRTMIQRRYIGCEFHVIYWDNEYISRVMAESAKREVLNRLSGRGIRVHLISDILPDANDVSKYALDREDLHPTPLAHEIVSEYVVQNILAFARSTDHPATRLSHDSIGRKGSDQAYTAGKSSRGARAERLGRARGRSCLRPRQARSCSAQGDPA